MAELCYETFKTKDAMIKNSKVYVHYSGKHEIIKSEGRNSYPSRFILLTLTSLVEEINPEHIENLVTKYGVPVKVIV